MYTGLNMEGSPSGLWRRLGKAVCGQLHRGFESLSLRQAKIVCRRGLFQFAMKIRFEPESIEARDASGMSQGNLPGQAMLGAAKFRAGRRSVESLSLRHIEYGTFPK